MNELERLRTLLVGPQQEVSRRAAEPELRPEDVAEVLPESLTKTNRDALAQSLKEPVEQCLAESLLEHPEKYSDALYPILRGVIQRSVGSAFRERTARVSSFIEESLTPKVLKSRIRAEDRIVAVLWTLLLALVGLIAYLSFNAWIVDRELSRLEQVLDAEPGVFLTGADRIDGRFVLEGMRDPLAREIGEIVAGVDIDPGLVDLKFHPFQSLEPEILLRRVADLAESQDLRFRLRDQVLIVEGPVLASERERFAMLAPTLGIEQVSFFVDDLTLQDRLVVRLQPERTLTLRVQDGVAHFQGVASLEWIGRAESAAPSIPGLVSMDLSGVASEESVQFQALMAELSEAQFTFRSGTTLQRGERGRLLTYTDQVQELLSLASALKKSITFRITGHTDSSGDPARNSVIAKSRAEVVKQALVGVSVPQNRIVLYSEVPESTLGDAAGYRKSVIAVESHDL